MIYLKKTDYQAIVEYGKKGLPDEACGLLAGRMQNGIRIVERVYYLKNIERSPEHFSMDPLEQLEAVRDMRNNGWSMIGNFHSHPETPARPSGEDKKLAFDSKIRYFILSLADRERPDLRAFSITDHETVLEEEILILQSEEEY